MLYGPIFVADLERDLDIVEKIFTRDYSDRWRVSYAEQAGRTKTKHSGRC